MDEIIKVMSELDDAAKAHDADPSPATTAQVDALRARLKALPPPPIDDLLWSKSGEVWRCPVRYIVVFYYVDYGWTYGYL